MSACLMAVGGAMDLDGAIPQAFLERSGGVEARIAILPTASSLADSGKAEAGTLQQLGLKQPAAVLPIRTREDALREDHLAALRSATGVFITGGNQMRLSAALAGTPALAALKEAYRSGCVIAGTSAGASALSNLMIAYGKPGQAPRHNIVQLVPGLGFIEHMVIDQHFNQRNRLGRLLYIVAASPDMLGVGVDENTAAVITADRIGVVGAGGVTIVDGAELADSIVAEVERNQLAAYSGARLHLLTSGCVYHIASRTASLAKKPLVVE